MSQNAPLDALPQKPAAVPAHREVRYEHSRDFIPLMAQHGAALLVSTYQTGKLVVIGAHQGALALSFHSFEQAMGLARRPERIAVGTRNRHGDAST